MDALEILKRHWGHESFRPMQEEIISAATDGRDVLAILPTAEASPSASRSRP